MLRSNLSLVAVLFALGTSFAWATEAGSPASPTAESAPKVTFQSCWKAINDAYYHAKPEEIDNALKDLEGLRGALDAETYNYVKAYGFYRAGTVNQKKPEALKSIQAARDILEKFSPKKNEVEFLALQSAVDGMMAGLLPREQAAHFGMESVEIIGRALNLAPSNPRVLLVNGINLAHTPEQFGGGRGPALEQLGKAVKQFKQSKAAPFDWGQAEARAWIGFYLLEKKDLTGAKQEFKQALELRPDFSWVKYVLLPKAEGKES